MPRSIPSARADLVGDEDVVADELDLVAQHPGELGPALEIVLRAAILDGDDGEFGDEAGEVVHHAVAIQHRALPLSCRSGRP